MARPKKIVETKDELIEVKDEVVETKTDEKTEAEIALEAKDKEMQEMKTQMEMQEMKIQMEMLMKQMVTTNQSVQVGKTNDIDVAVGCRALNGACLANKSGDIEYNIRYKDFFSLIIYIIRFWQRIVFLRIFFSFFNSFKSI